jgi:hypothetical protein
MDWTVILHDDDRKLGYGETNQEFLIGFARLILDRKCRCRDKGHSQSLELDPGNANAIKLLKKLELHQAKKQPRHGLSC